METAIIVIILVFLFVIGGMITFLKAKTKLPDDYDKSKSGFDDEEDDDW